MALRSLLLSTNRRIAEASTNAPPLKFGERGEAIQLLQLALLRMGFELAVSTREMSGPPDGIFGLETKNAVVSFQRGTRLSPDGVPGAKTLGALDALLAPRDDDPSPPVCNTCSERNYVTADMLRAKLQKVFNEQTVGRTPMVARYGGLSLPGGIVMPSGIENLTGPQEKQAEKVYGDSLDFSRIYISDGLGLDGRGFTVALDLRPPTWLMPNPFPSYWIVIINCGTLSPSTRLLIHELAHAWQSQHHMQPRQFMVNSASSQALAKAVKKWKGSKADPYSYKPGKPFGKYAAEQIAQQVQNGEAAIVSHVASLSRNAIDGANMQSLSVPRYEIEGAPGTKR